MKNLLKVILFTITIYTVSFAQPITVSPTTPTQNDSIVIFLNTTLPGATELLNYTGTIYAHTGVTTNLGTWQHVIGSWGQTNQPALERLGANLYKLTIGYPRTFYNVTNPVEKITQLDIVFRSADGSKQTRPDIFVDIYEPGLNLIVQNPVIGVYSFDPPISGAFVKFGETVPIVVNAVELGTKVSTLTLAVDGNQVAQTITNSISYDFVHSNFSAGPHTIKVVGVDTSGLVDSTSFILFSNPAYTNSPLPAGIRPGINYTSVTSATLALFAPYKEYIYLIGDFNNWTPETSYFLNRHFVNPDSVIWWIELNSLSPGTEYAYQYWIDGEKVIADPYSEKILHPFDDQYIPSATYPNLKQYPSDKTVGIVGIIQTGQSEYQWQATNYVRPAKEKLVIYELLVRDFSTQRNYQFLVDTLSYLKSLGVNAIELMPIMEFSGNLSWGYNPIYHAAADKYYGTANKLKEFIDVCHQNGIAVILDMVLNQADNLSPLAMMWWDAANSRPAANSPYLNPIAKHPFNVFNDFNHESFATKYFVDRVNEYWLTEFKFDGFRFDLSKGFTQFNSGGNVGLWGQYDQSRVNILKRMADKIWDIDSTAYVILEHFADNSEEIVLSNYGMMLWGNHNCNYNQATMGYASGPCGSWDFSGISYKNRGWINPNLVGYMESHDEERLMYKNLMFGNSDGDYNIKNLNVALNRQKLAGAFFFTIPGPKLMWQFGELGYDVSIDLNGRTGEKPVKWDYLNDERRTNLYKVYSSLIKLKNDYEVFSTDNFTLNVSSSVKKINLNHASMDAFIIGNFGVTQLSSNQNFSRIGWWYDYFSGDSVNVTNLTESLTLEPGDFRIYTTTKLPTPEAGILLDVEQIDNQVPVEFTLEQNYPNPFNPNTIIRYSLPNVTLSGNAIEGSRVILKIYDILGKEVKTLVNQEQTAGVYQVTWNGDDELSNKVSTGVYFYRIDAGDFVQTKKMLMIK